MKPAAVGHMIVELHPQVGNYLTQLFNRGRGLHFGAQRKLGKFMGRRIDGCEVAQTFTVESKRGPPVDRRS